TRNDDSLDILNGSFNSFGPLLGDMNPVAAATLSYESRVAPFLEQGSARGAARDWDSDGDLDIGSTATLAAGHWICRASAMTFATIQGVTNAKGYSRTDIVNPPQELGFGPNDEDTIIDPTTSELRVGTIHFAVTGGTGTAQIQFTLVPAAEPGSALWFEDGSNIGKYPGGNGGVVLNGAPV